ncbi:four helix bundle protein [candidate division WOR-3 bacterium]|nr:four helix bundle protein [candidate division WOR-3 bacterium]
MVFRFENLEIWKMAIEYGEIIHMLTKKFPKTEQFVLTTDLNRAAVSVSSNIAEGSGSESNKEFKRYLRISIKSIFETISQLYIARIRKYIFDNEYFGSRTLRSCGGVGKIL